MNWHDILDYVDGVLYWKVKPSQKVYIGDEAGSISDDGYIKVMYRKRSYGAHCIVWEMHHGKIPDGMEVDHINHIRTDNRIENLRLVSRSENMKNKSRYSNNKSGITGVNWHSTRKKWIAQIQAEGKKIMLYEGSSLEEAINARRLAEKERNFHKNHGGNNGCNR